MRFHFLTRRERELIDALMHVVIPTSVTHAESFRRRMFYHLDRFLTQLPQHLRWLFHIGAVAFDLSPLLFLQRGTTFRKSDRSFQQYWVNRIYISRWEPLYRWFHVLRGLILLVYYSQDEQHKRLGYFPREWLKQKVMERRRKLNLVEEAADDIQPTRFPSKSS